jgi:ABC-type transport system involved in multi-copper enzyme maturation permease subunit
MLTLMSKPVQRWEVMVGKYLGIILAAALAVGILGLVLILATYFRIPNDYLLQSNTLDDQVRKQIYDYRAEHIYGLLPQLVLTWLQISVLAAIGVALSTRFSLVVNLPAVIILYLAGNMSRFVFPIDTGSVRTSSGLVRGVAWFCSLVLPYLNTFDLKEYTVLSSIKVAGINDAKAIAPSALWMYVGAAALYAVTYAVFALCAGMWSFQTRELGGGEG